MATADPVVEEPVGEEEAETEVISYPLRVDYCGLCSMPPEYCEYGPDPPKCYEWMKTNLPTRYAQLVEGVSDQLEGLSVDKRQTRGGKASKAARKTKKKLQFEVTKFIKISRAQRGKKKTVTIIIGLKTFGIDLKKASKMFAQHFSCGSSVTGDDEIVIQGDVCSDVIDFIQQKWPEVDDDSIELSQDHKR